MLINPYSIGGQIFFAMIAIGAAAIVINHNWPWR